MKKTQPGLGSRVLIGAIAGFVGTMAMTSAMRRMHERLPPPERYPLTPRQIVDSASEQAGVSLTNEAAKDVTTAAHFAYGAASGALLGVANVMLGPMSGGAAGVGVWLASYMGWIPGVRILKPAADHPPRHSARLVRKQRRDHRPLEIRQLITTRAHHRLPSKSLNHDDARKGIPFMSL